MEHILITSAHTSTGMSACVSAHTAISLGPLVLFLKDIPCPHRVISVPMLLGLSGQVHALCPHLQRLWTKFSWCWLPAFDGAE